MALKTEIFFYNSLTKIHNLTIDIYNFYENKIEQNFFIQ